MNRTKFLNIAEISSSPAFGDVVGRVPPAACTLYDTFVRCLLKKTVLYILYDV